MINNRGLHRNPGQYLARDRGPPKNDEQLIGKIQQC